MKRVYLQFIPIVFLILLVVSVMTACGNGAGGDANSADTVAFATKRVSDTTRFVKANGMKCEIIADATVNYPKHFGDKATTAKLQQLFASLIVDGGDTLRLDDAMQSMVTNSLHQLDTPDGQAAAEPIDESDDTTPIYSYHTVATVNVHYNANHLLTLCKVFVVKKNDRVTSVSHTYYNIDLDKMAAVDLHALLRDDALTDVTQALRTRLLEQNKVATNDELNDLGYFNIDNLAVSSNFYIDPKGVTWSYLPSELAVDAVGEPEIMLDWETLQPFLRDNTIVSRLK